MFKDAPVVREQIKKCVRCGKCRSVCPIFQVHQTEDYSPRGQVFLVQMLRDGELDVSEKVAFKASDCLMCEACASVCPSGIAVPELVAAARAHINTQRPSTGKNLLFGKLWTNPFLLRKAVAAASLADGLGLRKIARALGITRILPGDLAQAEKILATIPSTAARGRIKTVSPAQGTRKMRLAYFLGCGTDLLHPEVALATVAVLNQLGCEVVVPPELKCCGLPHLANGQKIIAEDLVQHNLDVLHALDVEVIISDCASCTSTLKGPLYKEGLKPKVYDLTEFIVDVLGLPSQIYPRPQPLTVTYHDPCHLVNAQKIKDQPRRLLEGLPGVKFIEMADAATCCGGSGTFGLTHYALSMQILEKKIERIRRAEIQAVTTCCPSCITQLSHGLREHGLNYPVLHPVQLLQDGLSKEPQ